MGKHRMAPLLVVSSDAETRQLVDRQLTAPTGNGRFVLHICTDAPSASDAPGRIAAAIVDVGDALPCAASPAGLVAALTARHPELPGIVLAGRDDLAAASALVADLPSWRVVAKPWRQDELPLLVAETIRHAASLAAGRLSPLPRPTVTTLRTAPVLAELPDSQLEILAAVATWQRHVHGTPLIHQNAPIATVLFLVSGFAKIVRGGPQARLPASADVSDRRANPRPEAMVALVGPGDIIGEIAALLDTGRSASAIALTPCEVIELPSQDFLSCMQRYPPFSLAVARKLAKRLVDANRQVELMRGDLAGRIHALLRRCREQGLDTDLWLSNAEIARMVGASRVAVSQIMGKLEAIHGESSPPVAPQTADR